MTQEEETAFRNLLAVMNGDGGQRQNVVGLIQAAKEA